LHELFAPEEMGFNVCRTCVGASDYSRTVYSFDESAEADPELKHFSIDHDKEYILPVLREARKAEQGAVSVFVRRGAAGVDEGQ